MVASKCAVVVFWLLSLHNARSLEEPVSTSDLLKMIEDLQLQGNHLKQQMVEREQNYETQIKHHVKMIASLQATLIQHNEMIQELRDDVFKLKSGPNERHGANNHRNDVGFRKENSDRKSKRLVTEGPFAFHAEVRQMTVDHIAVGQKIPFDTVLINLGGGYNNQSGVFTATMPGMYIFSTSVMSGYKPHNEIWVFIMKNGASLGGAFAYGDASRDQGSVTVVTELAAGDQVWVSLAGLADDSLWGHGFTSFMGSLVMYI